MLLVVTYSQAARATLRNVCGSHETAVVRRFGRAALFAATELGAFLALRMREKHGGDVQLSQTEPFNEFAEVKEEIREAATAYETRDSPSTPYTKFVVGTDHPTPEQMRGREL
ncbi:hypothetical protein AUR64_00475 [Haloprofundus marisrubri]|uniref:Uncharacterized protein n=1 Tax=Haloprofundus marisrubri TaxID=1514971 RepID=A0A0W1R4D2_9EURY|nr:hypothetical protein [Haloprofundus marisrubri]KTG08087.1 hypothetical protein AUR64_00475 [Haloprofundus marisrubri]